MTGDAAHDYEFRVAGHLDDRWSTVVDGLDIAHCDDGTSTLTASVADQAQLHGILARLRDTGTTLLSCRALDLDVDGAAGAEVPGPSLSR